MAMSRQPTLPRESFRPDINGLRAYAVVLVVLYHFGVPGFAGGFAGVDVFFVISGYLMTTIIVKGLEHGNFQLLDFYLARARRIVPALLVVCAALLLLGWNALAAPDYKSLASHVVYSLLFASNVEYWLESGYFDAASHDKWLLHTWSLSVEWQFYLVLPVLLLVLWKVRASRRLIVAGLSVLAGVSLTASMLLTKSDASHAFYLLHTRAWELLVGGCVGLLVSQPFRGARWMAWAGLAAILLSGLLFDQTTEWPGLYAALPVAGTAAVIASSQHSSIFTAGYVVQRLGDMSYSIYLWHWPVVVAIGYLGNSRSPELIVAGLALTLALGAMSYQFVERPTRSALIGRGRWLPLKVGLALCCAVALPAALIHRTQGQPGRLPEAVEAAASEMHNGNPRLAECHQVSGVGSPSCVYGLQPVGAILLGDSHANALAPALAAVAAKMRQGVVEWSYSGCPTLRGADRARRLALGPGYSCPAFNEWVLGELARHPNDLPIVIINRSSAYYAIAPTEPWEPAKPLVYFVDSASLTGQAFRDEFQRRLVEATCSIAAHRPVYLMRPVPEMPFNIPKTLSRRLAAGWIGDVSIPRAAYQARHAWVWAAQDEAARRCGARILDPLPYLCDNERCYGSRNGRPLYYDDDHLSLTGNALLSPMFAPVFAAKPLGAP